MLTLYGIGQLRFHIRLRSSTTPRFDNYELKLLKVSDIVGQGEPLSMFLYLFHNASMLELAVGISQIALGLADDLALIAVGSIHRDPPHSLQYDG